MGIYHIDFSGSNFFFHKNNDKKYRFFCPEERKPYGPVLIRSEINEDLLRNKYYPLKKQTPEDYLKELFAFSSPMKKLGQPVFTKRSKLEKDEDEPLEETEQLKEESGKYEDVYGSVVEAFSIPDSMRHITEFLKGRDRGEFIKSLSKGIFQIPVFRKFYISALELSYDYFSEEEMKKETPEQRAIRVRKDEVKNIKVFLPETRKFLKEFLTKTEEPLKGFHSLESIKFEFKGAKKLDDKSIGQDEIRILSNFIDRFLRKKYVKKVIIKMDYYHAPNSVQEWSCSFLKTIGFESPLPNSVDTLDVDFLDTSSDMSKIKTLNIYGLDSSMVPKLTSLKDLNIYGDGLPWNISHLTTLEFLKCDIMEIEDIPPNLTWLETHEIEVDEDKVMNTDADDLFPKSLKQLFMHTSGYFFVPSWLEKLSISHFDFKVDQVQTTLNRMENLKRLHIGNFFITEGKNDFYKSQVVLPNSLEELRIDEGVLLERIVIGNNIRSFTFFSSLDLVTRASTVLRIIKSSSVNPNTGQLVPLRIQEITIIPSTLHEVPFKTIVQTGFKTETNTLLRIFQPLIREMDVRIYISPGNDDEREGRVRVEKGGPEEKRTEYDMNRN